MWLRRIPTQIIGGTGARGVRAVNFRPRHFFRVCDVGRRCRAKSCGPSHLAGGDVCATGWAEQNGPRVLLGCGGHGSQKQRQPKQRRDGPPPELPANGGRGRERRREDRGRRAGPRPIRHPTARRYGPRPPNTPELGPKPGSGSSVRLSLSGRDCEGDRNAPCQKRAGSASGQAKRNATCRGVAERKPGPTAQLGFRRPPAHRPAGPARRPEKRRRRLPRPGRPW